MAIDLAKLYIYIYIYIYIYFKMNRATKEFVFRLFILLQYVFLTLAEDDSKRQKHVLEKNI